MSPHKQELTLTLTDLNKKYIPVIPARGAQWWSPEGAPPAFGIPQGRASHWWGPIGLVELDRRRLSGRYNCSSGPDSGSSDSWPQSLGKEYIQITEKTFFPLWWNQSPLWLTCMIKTKSLLWNLKGKLKFLAKHKWHKYGGIIFIHGGQSSLLTKILLVHWDVILWATGLLNKM